MHNRNLEQWYPRGMLIMVEVVNNVREEEINKVVEVEEIVKLAKLQRSEIGKSPVKMIELSVTPFWARARHGLLTW